MLAVPAKKSKVYTTTGVLDDEVLFPPVEVA